MPYKDKQKRKEQLKKYYKENREAILLKEKAFYKENSEKKKKYGREYFQKNKVIKEKPTENQIKYWETLKNKKPWNWTGKTHENRRLRNLVEYQLWRKACFERDNYTCQKTKISGGDLEVHHINNFADYPDLRLAIDNGITLSKKMHREFHKIYGNKNNTMEQIVEFLCNPSPDQQTTIA